jgi:hypothetical protein
VMLLFIVKHWYVTWNIQVWRTWNKHPVLCPWVCFSQRASHDCLGQPQSAVFQPLPLKYLGLQGCTTKPFLFLVESLINFFAWAGFKPLK